MYLKWQKCKTFQISIFFHFQNLNLRLFKNSTFLGKLGLFSLVEKLMISINFKDYKVNL